MKQHLTKGALMLVSLGWLVSAAPSAQADPMTLQDLLNGGQIMVGGALFSDFGNFSTNAVGGLAIDPSQVHVIPHIDGGKIGLKFQGNGQTATGANGFLNAHFEFKVTGRDSTTFTAAALELTASAHGPNSGAHVAGVLDNGLPGLSVRTTQPPNTSRTQFPNSLDRLVVGINLQLTGGAEAESLAQIENFMFFVHRNEGQVDTPEPATLTMLGLGAAGLIGYRWRRSRRRD
jgi:hypothetical protein